MSAPSSGPNRASRAPSGSDRWSLMFLATPLQEILMQTSRSGVVSKTVTFMSPFEYTALTGSFRPGELRFTVSKSCTTTSRHFLGAPSVPALLCDCWSSSHSCSGDECHYSFILLFNVQKLVGWAGFDPLHRDGIIWLCGGCSLGVCNLEDPDW